MMDDFISRQAAIEAAVKMFEVWYGRSVLRDKEIRSRFDALPSAPRWIPVTERLPSVGEKVLVIAAGKGKQYVETDTLLATGEWFDYGNVTHWMPLPEPYKAERSEDGET